MEKELLVGAHMSIAGGVANAVAHGVRAGCRALQLFLKNSNQWAGKPIGPEDCAAFRAALKSSGIGPVVAHTSYLINVASPDAALRKRSVQALVDEMERANLLGVPAVVLHPGAHMGAGDEEGIRRAAGSLNEAIDAAAPPARILIENTAGQGTCLGHSFEHLAGIFDLIKEPSRVGFCLDTCHLFAAGYDIRTEAEYARTISRFTRLIGHRRIEAFHVNDCKKDLGCRVDRHTHIGKGFIGLDAFRYLVNDSRFSDVPKILETPKGPDLKEDIENLSTLRSLYAAGGTPAGHRAPGRKTRH
jgi:deoxyribonuclease IV